MKKRKESAVKKIIRVVFPNWNKKKEVKPATVVVEEKRSREGALKSLGKREERERMEKEIEDNLEGMFQFFATSSQKIKEMAIPVDLKKLKQNSILATYKERLGQFNVGADQMINTFKSLKMLNENPGCFFDMDPTKLSVNNSFPHNDFITTKKKKRF